MNPDLTTVTSAAPIDGAGDGRVCRVVICDDQPAMRDAIRFTLAVTAQFAVIADAADAHSCLDQVRITRPDLLILDVNMPGGGPQVAAAAKTIHPNLHIVVFSGRTDTSIQQAMLAAGADQYVLKTGHVQPLLSAMETAYQQLSRSGPAGDPL